MPKHTLSVPLLRRRIETKAYAYGVSSTVATLLSEYVIEILRQSLEPTPQ